MKLESLCGNEITRVIATAISMATPDDHCEFEFNGVTVFVSNASDPALIYRDWQRGMSGYLGKSPRVGPYPTPTLSDDELASDAAIQAENDRKSAERRAEYDKQQAEKTTVLQGALSVAGHLELSDAESWQKCVDSNKDGYGGRCVRYAEEWGRLMQTRIANGETIAECAKELSHLADDDGITGFMYGAAVSMLSKCWKHGEELRRWHNKDTQIGTEGDEANESGGVLNPALLCIGKV